MDGARSVGRACVSSISTEMDIGAVLDSYASYVVCPAEIERNSKVYLHHQVPPPPFFVVQPASFESLFPTTSCLALMVGSCVPPCLPRAWHAQIAKHWAFFFARASNADAPKEELYKFAGFLFKLIYRYGTARSWGGGSCVCVVCGVCVCVSCVCGVCVSCVWCVCRVSCVVCVSCVCRVCQREREEEEGEVF
jgi:hypothetical protein